MANQKTPRPKTQREILLNSPVQDTYKNPENGETTGNPNRAFPDKSRANQISFRDDTTKPFSLLIVTGKQEMLY